MDFLVVAAAGLVISFVSYLVRDRLTARVRRRRGWRVKQGRAVSFPVSLRLDDAGPRRARLFRREDRMYVRTWRRGYSFAPFAEQPVTESGWIPLREWDVRKIRMLRDDRRVVEIGVVTDDLDLVTAVMSGEDRPAPRIAVGPAVAAVLFGIIALAPGVFALASYDAVAEVMSTDAENTSCQVRWEHGGQVHYTGVDCTDDDGVAAPIGSMTNITAQRWPFAGEAVSGSRTDALPMMALLVVPVLLCLALGWWRARAPSRPIPLRPVPLVSDVPAGERTTEQMLRAPLGDVVRAYQVAQRLPSVESPGRPTDSLLDDAVFAGRHCPTGGFIMGCVGSLVLDRWLLPDDLPGWWAVLPAAAGAVTVLLRFLTIARALRRLWRMPATSRWDGLAVSDPGGQWQLLLGLGSQIHWMATLDRRPPLRDTWSMHGEPGDGFVRLVAGADGSSRFALLEKVDDDLEREIREDLLDRLAELEHSP